MRCPARGANADGDPPAPWRKGVAGTEQHDGAPKPDPRDERAPDRPHDDTFAFGIDAREVEVDVLPYAVQHAGRRHHLLSVAKRVQARPERGEEAAPSSHFDDGALARPGRCGLGERGSSGELVALERHGLAVGQSELRVGAVAPAAGHAQGNHDDAEVDNHASNAAALVEHIVASHGEGAAAGGARARMHGPNEKDGDAGKVVRGQRDHEERVRLVHAGSEGYATAEECCRDQPGSVADHASAVGVAPGKQRADAHEGEQGSPQRDAQEVEVRCPHRDLVARERLDQKREQRTEQHGERERHEQHVVEQVPALAADWAVELVTVS